MKLSKISKEITLKQTPLHMLIKKGFKVMYPIYSIDLSNQPQITSGVKSNIILHVDFNKSISGPNGTDEGTFCYVVVVSKCMLCYEATKNMITHEY
jgi:hypothetical protein